MLNLDKANGVVRVASFNASLNRDDEGALIADMRDGTDPQARSVAEIIQKTDADVILINEFDYDPDGAAAEAFRSNYLAVGQNGAAPIDYPYLYVAPSNTGLQTGLDLDNDGDVGGPGDAQGFGFFPGQFGFVIFSKHPIDQGGIRTFQEFLWRDMPDALLPPDPSDADGNGDLSSWYTPAELDVLRLSSKNHVDVPVLVNGETVHILAAHPTPPVFDGPEDRNGTRNHDEIRFWADYTSGADYVRDDAGQTGGLPPGARFVIVGDYNADPFDGDSTDNAIRQLLDAPQIRASATDPAITPAGPGGAEQALAQGGANLGHQGNPAFDTSDFGFNPDNPAADLSPGNLRVDYVLPSASGLGYEGGGVFWPERTDPDFALAAFPTSDHRLVFADLVIVQKDASVPDYTLELLHFADQEAGSAAVTDAPNLSAVLNGLRAQDLGEDGEDDNTITLSSGDAIIPGLFYDASAPVFGSGGIADIQIQNELGVQAIALGNHEFDFGTRVLSELITGQDVTDDSDDEFADTVPQPIGAILGSDFGGTDFPYLSANLNFSTDAFLGPLAVEGGQAPQGGTVTSSVVLEEIGVVGATTPTLAAIASPGDVGILPDAFDATPTAAQLDALAAVIQSEVDALVGGNPGLNKIILLSHMQRLGIEEALAERLEGVDIIVAGGSNTRLFDDTDRARPGDSDQGPYPIFVDNAGGSQTAVVNTDGSYKYVGRLVIDFDANGDIIPESYDAGVSGAYATDAQGVADLGAEALVDPEIQAIADQIEAQIIATESNLFGASDVFLNGNRSGVPGDPDGVRTQETNLGNLTADANLAAAQIVDGDVVVSIKNGGGIRASIGQQVVPAGQTEAVRLPTEEVVDGDGDVVKPAGAISQNDIQTTLAFNNGLTLLTLTRAELVAVLEHGVGALPDVAGQFPQIAGVEFSFDPAAPAGDRIVSAEIVDAEGDQIAALVRDGEIAGDAQETFRIVTLNFLADGGDSYPFPQSPEADRVDLDAGGMRTGDATFADDGSEQDALAEYLDDLPGPFAEADTGPAGDDRIQNLAFRDDDVFDGGGTTTGDAGNNRLIGTDADETLVAGGGRLDILDGGGGADTFVFFDTDGVRDTLRIGDFDTDADTLDLGGAVIDSALLRGTQLVITLDEDRDTIFLRGVADIAEVTLINDGALL